MPVISAFRRRKQKEQAILSNLVSLRPPGIYETLYQNKTTFKKKDQILCQQKK